MFGGGKPYFGRIEAQMLEDPHVFIQGTRVLHLRYRVRPVGATGFEPVTSAV